MKGVLRRPNCMQSRHDVKSFSVHQQRPVFGNHLWQKQQWSSILEAIRIRSNRRSEEEALGFCSDIRIYHTLPKGQQLNAQT